MLYPLQFKPIFRRYIWGGQRLASMLGKPIGDEPCAESWEVVDRRDAQSIVVNGALAGRSLHDLVTENARDLLGTQHAAQDRFPLLFKFLDCHRHLSVQVHPNDAQASRLDPPDLGKTEAWYVMAAEPGAVIYAGLQPGVDRETLAAAIAAGETESCLHRFEPQAGDCIFIPAGTVHALGAGLLVAEIQQSSDTTYRLFDWNRVDRDGNPRPLHIQEALQVIAFDRGPVNPQVPQRTEDEGRQRLVACDKFIVDRIECSAETAIGGDGRAHLLAVVDGEVRVAGNAGAISMPTGSTAMLPAAIGRTGLTSTSTARLLDIYLP